METPLRLRLAVLGLTAFLLSVVTITKAYPDHVPKSACDWMSPWHKPYTEPMSSSPPYKLHIYHPHVLVNMTVPICVVGAEPFKGMMIQAQDTEGNSVGSWYISEPETAQALNCTNPDDTVTHVSKKHKQIVSLLWMAPFDYVGKAVFKAAIVKSYSTFWTEITSEAFVIHDIPTK